MVSPTLFATTNLNCLLICQISLVQHQRRFDQNECNQSTLIIYQFVGGSDLTYLIAVLCAT